jgi:DNA-binding Lrp family transcriptional regulator
MSYDLDDVDRQLLELLQEDGRYAATELAERIGVSDNTIHNRMDRLREAGVISGYTVTIEYDRAGLELYFMFSCTTPISTRSMVAQEALSIPEVVEVTELMTGDRNLQIKVLGSQDEDITRIAEKLDQLSLEINDENLVRAERTDALELTAIEESVADSEE